jgi:predicted PhzF superfamily epimerase YddE/YHI9
MPTFHLVRVFIGTNGAGGNPLAVFLDGKAIPPDRRLAVTAELGYSESVFVDDLDQGRLAIFVPTSELPFAGHPTVGAAWLLDQIGHPVDILRVPAGDVPTWRDAEWTWVRAQPKWIDFRVNPNFVQMANAAEVDALPGSSDEPWLYAWAWIDEPAGRLRARSFPTWAGIEEDEASGAAAVLMGGRLGRELLISQGVGSEIVARPGPDGTVEIGGRCSLAEVGEYVGHGLSQAAPPRPATE